MDADGAGEVGEGEGAMWIRKGSYHVCTSNTKIWGIMGLSAKKLLMTIIFYLSTPL